jgi:S1-C subfamily serine protease
MLTTTRPFKTYPSYQKRVLLVTASAGNQPRNSNNKITSTARTTLVQKALVGAAAAGVFTFGTLSLSPSPPYSTHTTNVSEKVQSFFFLQPSHASAAAASQAPPPPTVDKPLSSPSTSHLSLPPTGDLTSEELTTIKLFQENTPSVVNISNIAYLSQSRFSMDVMKIPQGQGSGFIWDKKGHIVTNFHVVRGASEVRVALFDQRIFKAKIVGGDAGKDVAVLQLIAPQDVLRELKPVKLGNSSNLLVGMKCYAIGNPFGLDHSLSQGLVSGLNRSLSVGVGLGPSLRNVIQTDAAINPGNSGGVLLDSRGRLIGINTAIADPTGKGASSGVGFAIPVDSVKGLVSQILMYGRIIRPVLGITLGPSTALRQLGLEGVFILEVSPGSPAAAAGLQGVSKDQFGRVSLGDVITGVDGVEVKNEGDLFDVLDERKVGDKVRVELLRKGRERGSVEVVLAERAPEPSE